MRITAINPDTTRDSRSGNWSRRAVLALLSGISKGSLVLEENGELLHFGEAHETAELRAQVVVRDAEAWRCVLQEGSVGAGEAYMKGYWDTPDLVNVVRLLVLNMQVLQDMDSRASWLRRMAGKMFHLARRNSLGRARKNIAAHYDLNNDFFSLFLDPTMAYSSAIYQSEHDSLEQASTQKFRHICERLQLCAQDHLLEIGTGWGGLAVYAAKHYGCRVTTTTLSHEQYRHALAWVQREGLEDRVTLLEKDYRELEGQYDKLVSVEMIEAVGAEYYDSYFRACSRLLVDDGLMLIQAITISDQRYEASVKSIDFIKRYIFPGGQLPSNSVITAQIAGSTDMQLIGMEDITHDYARTLKAWRQAFWRHIKEVRRLGADEVFIRMWHFYLCFCEGSFMERVIHTGQFLMAKPGFRQLDYVCMRGRA